MPRQQQGSLRRAQIQPVAQHRDAFTPPNFAAGPNPRDVVDLSPLSRTLTEFMVLKAEQGFKEDVAEGRAAFIEDPTLATSRTRPRTSGSRRWQRAA